MLGSEQPSPLLLCSAVLHFCSAPSLSATQHEVENITVLNPEHLEMDQASLHEAANAILNTAVPVCPSLLSVLLAVTEGSPPVPQCRHLGHSPPTPLPHLSIHPAALGGWLQPRAFPLLFPPLAMLYDSPSFEQSLSPKGKDQTPSPSQLGFNK